MHTIYVHHAYYVQHVHMLHHVTRVSTDWACPVAHGKEKKMATSPSIVQALATLAGALRLLVPIPVNPKLLQVNML